MGNWQQLVTKESPLRMKSEMIKLVLEVGPDSAKKEKLLSTQILIRLCQRLAYNA